MYQAVDPPTSACLIFTENEDLVQITSHYNQSRLWSRHTIPNYTDHPQVNIRWIHCTYNFFTVQDFWATCACLENRVGPENFQASGGYHLPSPRLVRLCTCLHSSSQFPHKWIVWINQQIFNRKWMSRNNTHHQSYNQQTTHTAETLKG